MRPAGLHLATANVVVCASDYRASRCCQFVSTRRSQVDANRDWLPQFSQKAKISRIERAAAAPNDPAFLVISVLYYAFKFKMIRAHDLRFVKFVQFSNQTHSCQKILG